MSRATAHLLPKKPGEKEELTLVNCEVSFDRRLAIPGPTNTLLFSKTDFSASPSKLRQIKHDLISESYVNISDKKSDISATNMSDISYE